MNHSGKDAEDPDAERARALLWIGIVLIYYGYYNTAHIVLV